MEICVFECVFVYDNLRGADMEINITTIVDLIKIAKIDEHENYLHFLPPKT